MPLVPPTGVGGFATAGTAMTGMASAAATNMDAATEEAIDRGRDIRRTLATGCLERQRLLG